jgi:hypothetical protein
VAGERFGQHLEASFDVELPAFAFDAGYAPRLWALRRVGEMLEGLKLDADDDALQNEVFELARRYGVVTEFTYFRLDENDDLVFEYSAVPTDAVGATAVNTSASIAGYTSSSTAGSTVDAVVRYFQDRNFPRSAGYHTDATLDAGDDFVDVQFGSDLYFDWARQEADYSIHGFLSIARDMKFEHLGRVFRVTDPDRADLEAPDESTRIPSPARQPQLDEQASAVLVAFDAPDESTPMPERAPESLEATALSRGCSLTVRQPTGATFVGVWALVGIVLLSTRRLADSLA